MIEIFFMEVQRSRAAEAAVRDRVLAGKCVCGCGRDSGEHAKLGLSRTCYYQHREAKKGLSRRKAAAYDAKLMREGKLLGPHEVRRIKRTTVFDEAVRAVS